MQRYSDIFKGIYHGGGSCGMISFFPEPYPDELVYSWFARYGMRTGYTHYRAIAEDLYVSNTAKPNLEFIMELNPEAYKVVTRYKSFEDIIKQHTMFPYYVRFLPKKRRVKAYKLLLKMDKGYNDALYSRKHKTQCRQSLRYCPHSRVRLSSRISVARLVSLRLT